MLLSTAMGKKENEVRYTKRQRGPTTRLDEQRALKKKRLINAAAVLIAGTLALAGGYAANQNHSSDHEGSAPIGATADLRNDTATNNLISELYPELESIALQEAGAFTTEGGVTFNWFNFTPLKFNAQAASQLYSYFEKFAPPVETDEAILMPHQGAMVPVKMLQRRTASTFPLFIIDSDVPSPTTVDWGLARNTATVETSPAAGTLVDTDLVSQASYIRYMKNPKDRVFATELAYTNKSFAIEACQTFVEARSIDTSSGLEGQEHVCNSVGTAFASRQAGMDFSGYLTFSEQRLIDGKPMIQLTENGFNAIPLVGQILTAGN